MVRIGNPYQDPLRAPLHNVVNPQPYEYRPYNPSNLGMYGQKPRERKVYQRPPKPVQKPKRTFESNRAARGRDAKTGKMGPEYKIHEYQYREYVPPTPHKQPVTDPLKAKPIGTKPNGDVYYKLDKNNNDAIRDARSGYTKRKSNIPQEKYIERANPKPERMDKSGLAAVAPILAPIPMKQTPLPPPVTKSFKTTTTQTEVLTQEKTKSMSVQTDNSISLLAAPIPVTKKVDTRSTGVQCSEPHKKGVARGTQSDDPAMFTTQQFSPVQERARTPQYAEQTRRETPVYRQRRSPSPEGVPIIAAVPYKQTQSPKRRSPLPRITPDARWTPSPEVTETATVYASTNAAPSSHSKPANVFIPARREPLPQVNAYPDIATASRPTYNSGNGMFPYQSSKSRLPPEITACIEAYDCAHGP